MRNKTVDMYQSGKVYKAISKALGLQRTTVRAIIHKWRKLVTVVNLPRSGCPTKITPRAQWRLIQELIKELRTTSKELQASLASIKVSVYDSTIRNRLEITWPFDFNARVVFHSADFVKYFIILSVNFQPFRIGLMSVSTVKGDRKREIGQSPIKKKFRDSTISREDIDEAIANGIKLVFKEQQSTLDSVVTSAVRDAVDSVHSKKSWVIFLTQMLGWAIWVIFLGYFFSVWVVFVLPSPWVKCNNPIFG